MMKRKESAES